jgi:mediator of RNA polymerase II transcription subunit 6
MSATPLPPLGQPPPGADGAGALPPPPGTDMTGICFRDQLWLNSYPLDRNLVFDYFALSPFYDITCNNESLRSRQIHPLDMSQLTYDPSSAPHLSPICQKKVSYLICAVSVAGR